MAMTWSLGVAQLGSAWRRMCADHKDRRTFFRPPYLHEVIESDLDAWLAEIDSHLSGGSYAPKQIHNLAVPKPGGLIRPGAVVEPVDEVVYSAAVAEMVPTVVASLGRLDPHPDYAYRLGSGPLPKSRWFENWFKHYKAFTDDSVELLNAGYSHVVLADIAGYYEQVDLPQLRSDLLAAGVDRKILDPLIAMLHGWGPVEKRGLPQGYSASDVLAKFYLHSVDEALAGRGYKHLRWVDDFRVFVNSEEEGRRVLLVLAEQLGRRGLVLQSAKTRVVSGAQASERFTAVQQLLEPVQDEITSKLEQLGLLDSESVAPFIIDSFLRDEKGKESVGVLESAWEKYFADPGENFNKSLFRYLLRRLGAAGSHMPLQSINALLWEHPEETADILKYLAAVGKVAEADSLFASRMGSGGLVYDYQLMLFLEWRLEQSEAAAPSLLVQLRKVTLSDPHVACYVWAVLGRWGTESDRNDLVATYPSVDLRRRPDLLCSISDLEITKRNAFYGRVSGDSPDCARAVAAVKSGKVP